MFSYSSAQKSILTLFYIWYKFCHEYFYIYSKLVSLEKNKKNIEF